MPCLTGRFECAHRTAETHTSHLDRVSRAGGDRWSAQRGGGSVPCWGINRSGQEGGCQLGVVRMGVREETLRQKKARRFETISVK